MIHIQLAAGVAFFVAEIDFLPGGINAVQIQIIIVFPKQGNLNVAALGADFVEAPLHHRGVRRVHQIGGPDGDNGGRLICVQEIGRRLV